MSKITLTDLANLQNENTAVNAINNNNSTLETAMDNTLSRDGTSPNQMNASLDMNSHQILNLNAPLTVDSPLRLQDLIDFNDMGVINALPPGGNTGDVLTKGSNADYDVEWAPDVFFSITDYGAVADSTTDCTTAIQAAVDAAFDYATGLNLAPNGTVLVPAGAGAYRITSPINMPQGVSLRGEGGMTSCIWADNCDALHYEYNSGYGQPTVDGIFLCGYDVADPGTPTPPSSARIAIKRPQPLPLNAIDAMYGLSIQNTLIFGFDTAVDVSTVRNLWVDKCYFQNINDGIKIRGFSFGVRISGTQMTRADGDLLGSIGDGIVTLPIVYTAGSTLGSTGPEGVEIDQCQLFGFNRGLYHTKGAFLTFTNSDIQAIIDGIRFSDVFGGLYITNNYIALDGASNHSGIWGEGIATPMANNHQTLISGNTIIATNNVAGSGILINAPATANQDNVTIINNQITGSVAYDIAVFNPSSIIIENNRCRSSSGLTNSIYVGTRVRGIINVGKNDCRGTVAVQTASDLTNGYVRFYNNITSDTVLGGTDIYTATLRGTTTAGAINSSGQVAANTFNNVGITTPGSTAILTLGSGKTFTVNNTLTLNGTDSTTMTFPTTSATLARTDAANTFTGNQTLSSLTASSAVATDGSKVLVSVTNTGTGNNVLGTSPIITTADARGVWTAGATWTLPAHTLGGTVSGGGSQINNVIIGTVTPLAGFFTNLTASGTGDGVTITPSSGSAAIVVKAAGTATNEASLKFYDGATEKWQFNKSAGNAFYIYDVLTAVTALQFTPNASLASAVVNFNYTKAATSSSSASVLFAGGVGINGALWTNSNVMIASSTSYTNGAGAGGGTLTNAPAAGNPTKWIPVNDNGTTRYIPAW